MKTKKKNYNGQCLICEELQIYYELFPSQTKYLN